MTGTAALPTPTISLAVDATAATAPAAAAAAATAVEATTTAVRTGPGQASSAQPTEGGSSSPSAASETGPVFLPPVRTVSSSSSSSSAASRTAASETGSVSLPPVRTVSSSTSSSSSSSAASREAVSINGLLQLYPPHLEAELWQSASAVRFLRTLDYVGLFNAIMFSCAIIKAFFGTWALYQRVQAVFYLTQASVQLLVMHYKPQLYQRYRFQVTCLNRLLRIMTVLTSALDAPQAEPKNVNRTVGTKPGASPVYMLLHCVVAVPLFWWNHAAYVLPFRYALPVQLITCACALRISSAVLCIFSHIPGTQMMLAQQICQHMKQAMHYLGLPLLARPPGGVQLADAAAAECQGLNGAALVSLYVSVVLLVLIPCLIVYFAELNLKMGFIRQRQLVLQHALPCPDTRLARAVVVFAAFVCSWIACEGVVMALAPVQCGRSGVVLGF